MPGRRTSTHTRPPGRQPPRLQEGTSPGRAQAHAGLCPASRGLGATASKPLPALTNQLYPLHKPPGTWVLRGRGNRGRAGRGISLFQDQWNKTGRSEGEVRRQQLATPATLCPAHPPLCRSPGGVPPRSARRSPFSLRFPCWQGSQSSPVIGAGTGSKPLKEVIIWASPPFPSPLSLPSRPLTLTNCPRILLGWFPALCRTRASQSHDYSSLHFPWPHAGPPGSR